MSRSSWSQSRQSRSPSLGPHEEWEEWATAARAAGGEWREWYAGEKGARSKGGEAQWRRRTSGWSDWYGGGAGQHWVEKGSWEREAERKDFWPAKRMTWAEKVKSAEEGGGSGTAQNSGA